MTAPDHGGDNPLDALMPPLRQGVLCATVLNADLWFPLEELASRCGAQPEEAAAETRALANAGILEWDAAKSRTRARAACPFLPELRALLIKTAGAAAPIGRMLAPFGQRVRAAFIYGSMARMESDSTSDIDLMVVGEVSMTELTRPVRALEWSLGREIHLSLFTPARFRDKLREGNHYLTMTMKREKLFVQGGPDALAQIVEGAAD